MSDDAIRTCKLLSGPGAAAAQLSLAAVVLAALLLRRTREHPRREQRVFLFDVSKQFVSSGAAHFSGLAFSVAAAAAAGAGTGSGSSSGSSSFFPEQQQRRQQRREPSECGWYLVLFSVDTVIGSALAILLHRAAVAAAAKVVERETTRRARLSPPPHSSTSTSASTTSTAAAPKPPPPALSRFAAAVLSCGHYGSPPSLDLFLPQLIEWTVAVVLARLCCGFSVLALRKPLSAVAAGVDGLFRYLSPRPSLELFSVMLAGPLLMNAVQALVQDGVLRAKKKKKKGAKAARSGAGGEGGAAAAEADGGEEGAELLSSPSSSSAASPFSQHP